MKHLIIWFLLGQWGKLNEERNVSNLESNILVNNYKGRGQEKIS